MICEKFFAASLFQSGVHAGQCESLSVSDMFVTVPLAAGPLLAVRLALGLGEGPVIAPESCHHRIMYIFISDLRFHICIGLGISFSSGLKLPGCLNSRGAATFV